MGRLVLPNYPHHVVQRGHNRQVVFAADEDYQRYLADLRELKDAFGVKVYAYCLMTNHVHLLLAPGESIAGLGQLMKALAACATRYRNRLEGRSGTLWESRYKSWEPVQWFLSWLLQISSKRCFQRAEPAAYLQQRSGWYGLLS
jgi:putative transposase